MNFVVHALLHYLTSLWTSSLIVNKNKFLMLKENLRDYFVLNYNGICYAHVKPSQTSFSVRVWQVTLNNVFLHM
jgi:hypothetical protein